MILHYDVETTGFIEKKLPFDHPEQPRVVQLAAVLDDMSGNEIMRLDVIVRHDLDALPEKVVTNWRKAADAAHGISPEYADEVGITDEVVMELFRDFLAVAKVIVGHNIRGYDNDIIRCQMQRIFGANDIDVFGKAESIFDTMAAGTALCKLPRRNGGGFKQPTLTELHRHLFNEDFANAHQAISDVLACRRSYYEMMRIIQEAKAQAA